MLESKLLSGGIEPQFISMFKNKSVIRNLISLTGDDQSVFESQSESYPIYHSIIHSDINGEIDHLIELLQINLMKS